MSYSGENHDIQVAETKSHSTLSFPGFPPNTSGQIGPYKLVKAIRKERSHRYRSVTEFADDIRNYLNGDPLIAGPESAIYRLRKFFCRHRASVVGIVAVLSVFVAGVVVSTHLAIGWARADAEMKQGIASIEGYEELVEQYKEVSIELADKVHKIQTEVERLKERQNFLVGQRYKLPTMPSTSNESDSSRYAPRNTYSFQ